VKTIRFLALAAFAAAALAGATGGVAAKPPKTHVWVSPKGNDGSCKRLVRSKPCASFDRAYRVARPGDQVEVAGGSYPAQTIRVDSSKSSSVDVVFRPARGARVTLGCDADLSDCLAVEGKHVTVRGMRMATFPPVAGMPRQGGVCICRGSDDVTFVGLDAGYFYIAGDNARIIGGDYGPVVDQVSKLEYGEGRPPRNILIDRVFVHDHRSHDRHPECIAFYAGDKVTIRNSRFNNCETFGIFISGDDVPIADTLIENNFFSNTGDVSMSAHIKTRSNGKCSNMLFRFNTFVDKNVISECPGPNIRWESNIFTSGGCEPQGSFDYNVSLRGKCGAHDVVVRSLGLVNQRGLNFHLRPGSPARGRGNPASVPRTDIDGQRRPRPRGSRPDAGADERP
jgi:hypothetical protein